MWFITHESSGETLCFLPEKLKYTVGRLGADLELQNDICVSRAHAIFHLIQNKSDLRLEVEDVGSKYGTFYNNDIEKNNPLEKGHRIVLKDNDLIRFGRLQNVWKVHCMNINTVTSSLSKEDNENVTTHVKSLGGEVLEQWSPTCTHLTMKDPSITLKLLHALVDQKLIVTPEYWKDLLNVVQNKKTHLPKPELYTPSFGDGNINVGAKPERRSLFKDTTFVFLNRKHFDMYGPIIKEAGGVSKDLNSGVQKAFLIKNKVVVIQYTPSTQTQSSETISSIAEFLQSHSKRIIPEYEIGLAILHCSIEKFCNPCFKMTQTMPLTVPDNSQHTSMNIDLTDEQESTPSVDTQTLDLEIPETNENIEINKNLVTSTPFVEPQDLNANNSKEDESMPNIHITETPVPLDNQRKRKLNKVMDVDLDKSDEEDLFQFKSKKPYKKNEGEKEIREKSPQKGKDTTKDNCSGETKENDVDNEMPSTSTVKATKNVVLTNFLQKSQTKNKSQITQNKETRKRPHIQVLDENDEGGDEDLFSFGDTQKTKKSRPSNEKSTLDEDDDLFGFKVKETSKTTKPTKTIEVEDEDSNDMIPTQQFVVSEKPIKSKSSVQMPKPKILPRKVSAIDWLTGSMGKIRIKNENLNLIKEEDNVVKTESAIKTEDDLNISEDHRKWLNSLKDAIEIQQVALNNTIKLNNKSHYRFKNPQNDNPSANLNGTTMKNFKTFVKKYSFPTPQNSTIIKLHLR